MIATRPALSIKRQLWPMLILAVLALTAMVSLHKATAEPLNIDSALAQLQLPSDLRIERYADLRAYGAPRMLALDRQGRLLVSLTDSGRVIRLHSDGTVELIAQGLNAPHGLALLGDDLLIAEQTGVLKLPKRGDGWGAPQPFINSLPSGGHALKTVKVSPDGFVYVNVGSSCNVCIEEHPLRASLLRFTPEGRPAGALLTLGRHAQSPLWANGLRNSQGMAWHPVTGALFATNNGSDNRSAQKNGEVNDDLPPEHLNLIEGGKHYGWPYCWGDPANPGQLFQDPNLPAEAGICARSQAPAALLPAHSTPLGLTFLQHSHLPAALQNDLVVALHGSWNRAQPSGYALYRVIFRNHQPAEVVPFVTGWLQQGRPWGRPVDVIVGADGWLYVTDDLTGWIYRIRSAS